MFADFDRSLREMGVGDLSVGKHVKRMARAFYGRILSYEGGLARDDSVLVAALARNVFGTVSNPQSAAGDLTAYVRCAVRALQTQSAAALLAGDISFEVPPGPSRISPPCSSGEDR
jgi:cytochrome b pre-mRNA-processing protein 3